METVEFYIGIYSLIASCVCIYALVRQFAQVLSARVTARRHPEEGEEYRSDISISLSRERAHSPTIAVNICLTIYTAR